MREISEQKVWIDTSKARVALKENLEIHIKNYEKAYFAWAEEMVLLLENHAEAYRKDGARFSEDVFREINTLNADKPRSYAKEYEKAIAMLKHCVSEQIEVSGSVVGAIFEDQWDWSHDWARSASKYLG